MTVAEVIKALQALSQTDKACYVDVNGNLWEISTVKQQKFGESATIVVVGGFTPP